MAEELTPQVAQKIADGIMEALPYNINIMNRFGYIIASGDPARLNTLHMGAVQALSTLKPHLIHADTYNERRGVNLPIIHKDEVVGVIGISGEVGQVLPIAQIVLVTAKLMLENQEYTNLALLRAAHLRDFLFEWANYEKAYSPGFADRGRAVGVDIALPYVAVLFDDKAAGGLPADTPDNEVSLDIMLPRHDFVVWSRKREMLMALRDTPDLPKRIAAITKRHPNYATAYVGESGQNLSVSIARARQARKVAARLNLTRPVVFYEEVYLDQALLSAELPRRTRALAKALQEADPGGELAQTVYVYMNNTHDIAEACEMLHIHRNTLNYRLNRIQELTDKNPRNGRDLAELYLAVLHEEAN